MALRRALAALKAILIEIIDDGMTDAQKVRAIHDYLVMNVTYDEALYDAALTAQSLTDYKGFYLEGVLFDKVAVCEGISKAVTALCNLEGIPCVTVTGYQTDNPEGLGHAWNKVYLDGAWYVLDATSDGIILNGQFEVLSYRDFLVDEATYSSRYTARNFTGLLCENTYGVYEESTFIYGGVTYDFSIASQAELNALVGYFEGLNQTDITLEFYVAFEIGDSASDELATAYRNNFLFQTCSYVELGNIFIMIK